VLILALTDSFLIVVLKRYGKFYVIVKKLFHCWIFCWWGVKLNLKLRFLKFCAIFQKLLSGQNWAFRHCPVFISAPPSSQLKNIIIVKGAYTKHSRVQVVFLLCVAAALPDACFLFWRQKRRVFSHSSNLLLRKNVVASRFRWLTAYASWSSPELTIRCDGGVLSH
jgi:hypothetical protein